MFWFLLCMVLSAWIFHPYEGDSVRAAVRLRKIPCPFYFIYLELEFHVLFISSL
jgi:hypothetical protein